MPPSFSPPYRATSLVGAALHARVLGRIGLLNNLRHWKENSAGIQLAQLRNLLHTARHTVFGKQHNFERLSQCDDAELLAAYRSEVPVVDWYASKDLIARMREGAEPDVLWPGLVKDFAQTSGTTAGDKYIPVSSHMMKSNYLASLDIFANIHRFGVSLEKLLAGKSLFLGGSTKLDTSSKGIKTGDLSGIVTPLITWPLTKIYLPGPDIALLNHWPTKIDAMARRCLDEDVRMVSGMCSWQLVLFDKVMQLARDRSGGNKNINTIRDVWPNFRVLVHGGVKYAPFDPRMRNAYSGSPEGADIPCRVELYPASEAFVAIQDVKDDPGLRLNVDMFNYFEFVPLEEIDNPNPRAFSCWDTEKTQKYVVVLSTCAGMWRYVLGDVVEFDTIPDKPLHLGGGGGEGPCRLRIVGRHRNFINAFGENLIVEHIENAVADASKAAAITIGEFTAAPVYPRDGVRAGLELAVEVDGGLAVPANPSSPVVPTGALLTFRNAFDASLKSQNVDYTTKRTDGFGMDTPTITPLPLGTFHKWMESRGKLGGQHKCPRCANNRDIIEGVKSFRA